MIAACALVSGAGLATGDQTDFQAFVPHGLVLLPARAASESTR